MILSRIFKSINMMAPWVEHVRKHASELLLKIKLAFWNSRNLKFLNGKNTEWIAKCCLLKNSNKIRRLIAIMKFPGIRCCNIYWRVLAIYQITAMKETNLYSKAARVWWNEVLGGAGSFSFDRYFEFICSGFFIYIHQRSSLKKQWVNFRFIF